MRNDLEKGCIYVELGEFVSTARRALSTVPKTSVSGHCSAALSSQGYKISGLSEADILDLSHEFELSGEKMVLSGSIFALADGSFAIARETCEEAKKISKDSLAQARGELFVAAYILSKTSDITDFKIKTVFINIKKNEFTEKIESVSRKQLVSFFEKCKRSLSIYARPEIDRVKYRIPSLKNLKFPYPTVREGQNEFIRAVYGSIVKGVNLYAAAPTGTGKTVSVIWPALRALGKGKISKFFYFTPKGTTAIAAAECIELLASLGAKIKAVCLYSKERLCKSGLLCRYDFSLCENLNSKLSDAALALYDLGLSIIKESDIEKIAKQYRVCPHELSLCYAEMCDAVICDVNYLFDPTVYIKRFFTEGGDYAFLIDEAHNLPDRAREMFSAEISEAEIEAPSCYDGLGEFSETKKHAVNTAKSFRDLLYPYVKENIFTDEHGNLVGAAHFSEVPFQLYEIFETAVNITDREILQNLGAKDIEKRARINYLREYRRSLFDFFSTMNLFDQAYEMFVFFENGKLKAKLFCIDPGPRIEKRLRLGHSAVFFSGTLSPHHYYKACLGGKRNDETLEIGSPFDSGQLSVSIMDKISTRLSEREKTLPAVCRVIAATVSARRGNYMIFSPSFAYSEALYREFSKKYPKIRTLKQKKDMTPKEKADFLAEFSKEDGAYLIGFCVMGGIYSEGIDLAGDKLIGAVIVGIGLPSLSYEREAIAAYYQEKYDEGKEFAYVYPGINRVLQAAGRVIRREDDRGVIVLVDDRFDDPVYKKLIPKLWGGMKFISDPKALNESLLKFWNEKS